MVEDKWLYFLLPLNTSPSVLSQKISHEKDFTPRRLLRFFYAASLNSSAHTNRQLCDARPQQRELYTF
jgi:hypothetical protein